MSLSPEEIPQTASTGYSGSHFDAAVPVDQVEDGWERTWIVSQVV